MNTVNIPSILSAGVLFRCVKDHNKYRASYIDSRLGCIDALARIGINKLSHSSISPAKATFTFFAQSHVLYSFSINSIEKA